MTMSIERLHCIPVCGEIKGSAYSGIHLDSAMYSQRLYYNMSYIEQLVVEWVNSNSRDAATSLGGILPDLEVPV